MSKIIVITSGKGGVGKTTTAINLGAAINSLNEKVVIVDGNLTTPNIGLHLGAPIVPVTLNHVLRDEAEIHEAIYEHHSGTKIVPSDLSIKELKQIKFDKIQYIAEKLKETSDYVIFDSPAGLGEEALNIIDAGEELIIVTNPEIPAVTDALKTIKLAQEKGKIIRGVILNRVKRKKTEMLTKNIKEMLESPVLGIIPEDKNMQYALTLKDAIYHTHPGSRASQSYKKIAQKITGKESTESGFSRFLRSLGF
jgi:septum site-determining protein MinD